MMFENVALKHPISGDVRQQSIIFVFATCTYNLNSQFFDLEIENSLGSGTLDFPSRV